MHKTNNSTMLKANNISKNDLTKHMKQKTMKLVWFWIETKSKKFNKHVQLWVGKKTLNVFGCENKQNAMMSTKVELKNTTLSQCH